MRRVFVVLCVLAALAVPLSGGPAQAGPWAAVCTHLGVEVYDSPLPPLHSPPVVNLPVDLHTMVNCTGVANPAWEIHGQGYTTGGCAAEAGEATLATSWSDLPIGSAHWRRVGIWQVMVMHFTQPSGLPAVFEAHSGWLPANVTDCLGGGVTIASIQGWGPLVGAP